MEKKILLKIYLKVELTIFSLKKELGANKMSCDELFNWVGQRVDVSESLETPFLIGLESNMDNDFRLIMSTKRLILLSNAVDLIMCDSTYKVTKEEPSLTLLGSQDMDNVLDNIPGTTMVFAGLK